MTYEQKIQKRLEEKNKCTLCNKEENKYDIFFKNNDGTIHCSDCAGSLADAHSCYEHTKYGCCEWCGKDMTRNPNLSFYDDY